MSASVGEATEKSLVRRAGSRVKRWQRTMHERHVRPYVFIHINKTGGSSIEHALGVGLDHSTAAEKFEQLGAEAWAKKFTFTMVRNPWDKVVSHYHWRVKTNQTGIADQGLEFSEWVRRAFGDQDPRYHDDPRMFMPQRQWLVDRNDQMIVEFVGRFENLADDFEVIRRRLDLDATLGHAKPTTRDHYRTYYDSTTQELVERVYAEDLEEFGYSF